MTVSEEAGKVANSAVDALKGNPLCLSLVVLIAILGVMTYLRNKSEMAQNEHIVTTLMERCMEPAKR